MKRDVLFGGIMAIVGIGAFVWAAQDTLFVPAVEPTPTPRIFASEKPSLSSPIASVSPSDTIASAEEAIANNQFEYAFMLLQPEEKTPQVLNLLVESALGQGLYIDAQQFMESLLRQEETQENIIAYIKILLLKGDTESARSLLPKIENSADEKTLYKLLFAIIDGDNEQAKIESDTLAKTQEYAQVGQAFGDIFVTYSSFRDGSPHYLSTMLANMLKTLGFHALTVEYLRPVLQAHPEYRDAWIVMGNSYLALKKFEVAERMLEKALSLDPTHPVTPYLLGITLYELGQTDDAAIQIENAIKNGYQPREKAERYLGDMYFASAQYEKSLEHYQYILSDGTPTIKDYTRSVYIALNEIDAPLLATSFAQNAAENLPNNPAALALSAWTQIESGNIDSAIDSLQSLEDSYPNNQEIQLYLGKAFSEKKEFQKAFDTYEKCYRITGFTAVGIECAQHYEDLRLLLQNER